MDLSASVIFWELGTPLITKPVSVVGFPDEESIVVMDDSFGVSFWASETGKPVSMLGTTNNGGVQKKAVIVCRCRFKKRSACAVIMDDGVVAITGVHDGCLLDTSRSLVPHPQSAAPLPSSFYGSYIIVGDAGCNIVIIDVERLLIVSRLDVPAPGFVAAVNTHYCGESTALLSAVTANRTLLTWEIKEQPEEKSRLAILKNDALQLPQCGSPVAVSTSGNQILVVAIDGWYYFEGGVLCASYSHNPEHSILLNGCIFPSESSDEGSNPKVLIGSSDSALQEFTINVADKTVSETAKQLLPSAEKVLGFDMHLHNNQIIATTGTTSSSIYRKVFPEKEGGVPSHHIDASEYSPDNRTAAGIVKPTCSHIHRSMNSTSVMLKGYTDGTVTITVIGATTTNLKAHETAVGCMSVISSKFLITSDTFGEVSVWEWGSWRFVSTHCVHSKVIHKIVAASPIFSSRHGIQFWTIGTDGSIGFYSPTDVLFSLCGNGCATPAGVFFVEQTDTVVVHLGDKSAIHIWQLGSESLIRTITNSSQINACLGSLRDCTDFMTFHDEKSDTGSAAATGLGKLSRQHSLPLMSVSLLEVTTQLHGKRNAEGPTNAVLPAGLKLVLSYLLQAEENEAFVKLRDILGIEADPQPRAAISFWEASKCKEFISLPLDTSTPYKLSPVDTAQRLVFGISLQYALCIEATESFKQVSKAVIYQYASVIPPLLRETVTHFEADFFWCLDTIKVPHKDIQFAARCVLLGYLKNREVAKVIELAQDLIRLVKDSGSSEEEVQVALLGVSITAVQCPDILKNKEIAVTTCEGLLNVTTSETASTSLRTTALAMLANSYSMLASLIPNELGLIRALALMATSQPPYQAIDSDLNKVAFRALLTVGEHHLQLFFSYADHILSEAQVPKEDDTLALQNCVISAIAQMIKKNPTLFVPCLLKVALLFLKALDPHFPRIREKCMAASAHALKTAVSALPMMAFHQAKQSLAVGDVTGQAVVWDMKTGSKWLVWDAHTSGITCISFSTMGNQIGTFSLREGSLKIWSADMSLLSILSSSNRPRLIATRSTNTENVVIQSNEASFGASISWVSPHMVELTTHQGNSLQFEFR